MADQVADLDIRPLKLAALDEEDLKVVSAHVQDAVSRADAIRFTRDENGRGRLVIALNRFVHERAAKRGLLPGRSRPAERRRAFLHIEGVCAVRSVGFAKGSEAVLSLLAVLFEPDGDGPEGTIELVFSGDAEMQVDVEAIEVRLADDGAAWAARGEPRHRG